MEGEVEAVAVAGDIMWEEIKSGEDNVGWCADGEGEFVDDEMRRGEERRWGIGEVFVDSMYST